MSKPSCSLFFALIFATWIAPTVSLAQADTETTTAEAEDETEAEPPTTATPTETGTVPDKIRFAAIVQYATSGAERVDARKARVPLNFKDALYEGDRVHLSEGAYAKLILKNSCITVLYGDGQAIAPNREKPWRIRSEAMRWICPEGQEQKISFRGQPLDVSGSEVLVSGNRLLVLRGSPSAKGVEKPAPMSVYAWEKSKWALLAPQPNASEIYQLNESHKAPQESLDLPKPAAPPKAKIARAPANNRLMFGPVFGGGGIQHDQDRYSEEDAGADGGRVQWHTKVGNGSFILAATPFLEISNDEMKEGCFNCPAPGTSSSRLEMSLLEGGWRFNHQRWWSPYVRGGFAYMRNNVTARGTNGNYSNYVYEYYGLSAAAGMDVYIRPSWLPWLGLYAMAELEISRALVAGAKTDKAACTQCFYQPPPEGDPSDPFTASAVLLGFGIMGQF